jgi:ribosomal protein S18 acetylase RimI-like enzyme
MPEEERSTAQAAMATVATDVTTWYLEMRRPEELRARAAPGPEVTVLRAEIPSPEFSRFLYTAVGGDWRWTGRLRWNYDQWLRYLERPEVETWVAYVSGTPAGYVEMMEHDANEVEIVQFGLLPRFIGRGIGGYLLSVGTQRAWARGARRVWLHTCSHDGPHAVPNYQARGFRIYHEEKICKLLPVTPMGPWPGSRPA